MTEAKEEVTTAIPVKSESENIGEKMEEITEHLAQEMGIPTWGLVAIIIGKPLLPFLS